MKNRCCKSNIETNLIISVHYMTSIFQGMPLIRCKPNNVIIKLINLQNCINMQIFLPLPIITKINIVQLKFQNLVIVYSIKTHDEPVILPNCTSMTMTHYKYKSATAM